MVYKQVRKAPITLDGVSWPPDGGDIGLVGAGGIAVAADDVAKSITIDGLNPGVFNVREFGAVGIGPSGAADDHAAFVACMAAANAYSSATQRGAVFLMPPGDYFTTGELPQGPGVHVRGLGENATTVHNPEDTPTFTAVTGDTRERRGWRDFHLTGWNGVPGDAGVSSNPGPNGRGIVHGGGSGAYFHNMQVDGFDGGWNIHIENNDANVSPWTEGLHFLNVRLAGATRNLCFTKTAGASDSLSDCRMLSLLLTVDKPGGTGIWLDDGLRLYGGTLFPKFMMNSDGSTGIRFGANSRFERCTLGIFFEMFPEYTNTVAVTTAGTSYITGSGHIWPLFGDVTYPAARADAALAQGTVIEIGATPPGVAVDTAATGPVTLTRMSPRTQRFTGTFTANRTITLPASGLFPGDTFRIVRRQATGAVNNNLVVGSVSTLSATNGWVDAMWDGSAWVHAGAATFAGAA